MATETQCSGVMCAYEATVTGDDGKPYCYECWMASLDGAADLHPEPAREEQS